MENKTYDTLVLSGGAVKGIILLGAIQYAYDNKLLTDVKNYIGTSAGAIICYLLSIGYTPIEIIVYICTHRLIEKMQYFDFVDLVNNNGAISFQHIQECLEKMTLDKIGRFITMKELKEKYNKNLICVTYNMTSRHTEYISSETYPDIPCLTALRMSSNVPLLFEKFKYMGSYYIDGGISDNFPILKGEEIGNKVLGIRTTKDHESFSSEEDIGVLEYIFKIMYIPIEQSIEYKCSLATDKSTIVCITDKNQIFDFNIKSKVKLDMFSSGYDSFRKIIKEDKNVIQ